MPWSLNTIRFLNTHSRLRHTALRVLAPCTWQGNKAILYCFTQTCISVFLLLLVDRGRVLETPSDFFLLKSVLKMHQHYIQHKKYLESQIHSHTHTCTHFFVLAITKMLNEKEKITLLSWQASGWVKSRLECEILHSGSDLLKSLS